MYIHTDCLGISLKQLYANPPLYSSLKGVVGRCMVVVFVVSLTITNQCCSFKVYCITQ